MIIEYRKLAQKDFKSRPEWDPLKIVQETISPYYQMVYVQFKICQENEAPNNILDFEIKSTIQSGTEEQT